MPTPREQWEQMSAGQRGSFIALAGVDVALRAWALVDLARRPEEQVHGRKWWWGAGLSVVNSAGVLPATYLLWGRRAG